MFLNFDVLWFSHFGCVYHLNRGLFAKFFFEVGFAVANFRFMQVQFNMPGTSSNYLISFCLSWYLVILCCGGVCCCQFQNLTSPV